VRKNYELLNLKYGSIVSGGVFYILLFDDCVLKVEVLAVSARPSRLAPRTQTSYLPGLSS